MRFVILSLLATINGQEPSQTRVSEPPFIWDVVRQPLTRPLLTSFPKAGIPIPASGPKRKPDDCHFPLDVVILQDATESFDDNIAAMRETQLDLIFQGITSKHPDSRFAVVSFKDKPVIPLGNRDDYCTRFDACLTSNITEVKEAYKKIMAYGGYDAPENQFGTLYNVLATQTVGWSSERSATKLVVVSTDAGPHFGGDATTDVLPAFNPNLIQDENMDQCVARHYPTPEEMRNRVLSSGAYVASLVYDGSWADNWPSESWKTFNRFIGQSEHFVAVQAPDSKDFWAKLAGVIESIEAIECADHPTPIPPQPLPTVAPPATPPVTPPLTPPVTPPVTPPAAPGECVCPCTSCDCCPQVIIRLQHRPMKMHLEVDN